MTVVQATDVQTRARAFRLLLRRGYSQDIVESLLGSATDNAWDTE